MCETSVTQTLLDRILPNHLISDAIFSFASPATLLRLSRVCHATHAIVHSYLARTFNINTRLFDHFFHNPILFRSLQAFTGALASGPSVLHFLDRWSTSAKDENELQIYVASHSRLELGLFILNEGYEFVPEIRQHDDFAIAVMSTGSLSSQGVIDEFTFVRWTADRKVGAKIRLVVAERAPMEIILSFNSTCFMNVISYEKVYALYPRGTFEQRRTLSCLPLANVSNSTTSIYESNGWKIVDTLSPIDCAFRPGMRWIEDEQSWTLPLNLAGISMPDAPLIRDPSCITNWECRVHPTQKGATMFFDVLSEAACLRNMYVSADEQILLSVNAIMNTQQDEDVSTEANLDWPRRIDEEFIEAFYRFLEARRNAIQLFKRSLSRRSTKSLMH